MCMCRMAKKLSLPVHNISSWAHSSDLLYLSGHTAKKYPFCGLFNATIFAFVLFVDFAV